MEGARKRGCAAVDLGAVLAGLLFASPCAFALNPALEVSQYAHNNWKMREGFFRDVVDAIAQTLDGYLWLGTEFGLLPIRWRALRGVGSATRSGTPERQYP